MHYFDCLRLLKTTFIEGKDKHILADVLMRHFSQSKLSLLDIGGGDASYINKLADALPLKEVSIVVIDPLLRNLPPGVAITLSPRVRFVDASFEGFTEPGLFDVVHIRHSLYYLNRPWSALKRATALVKDSGLLILNLWSRRCWIYQLHVALFQDTDVVTAEGVLEVLKTMNNVREARLEYIRGMVNTDMWIASESVKDAAFAVIRRSRDGGHISQLTAMLEDLVRRSPDRFPVRVNGIIVAEVGRALPLDGVQ